MIQAQSADGVIHQFPDGTPDAVIDGAMKAYVAQGKPAAKPSLAGEILGAGGAAVDKLKTDVKAGYDAVKNRPANRPLVDDVKDSFSSLGRTGQIIGDVVGVPGAMVGAAQNALVSRPYGRAMSALTHGAYPEDRAQADMNTALMAASPAKGVSALAGAPKATSALADNVAAFDKAGVRPTLAAAAPGTAPLAKAAAETPIVGGRTRSALAASIQDTADAAQNVAGKYGNAAPKGATGEAVQGGIRTFAKGNDTTLPVDLARQLPSRRVTFGDKADALYTRAERLVGNPDAPISLPNTTQALNDVLGHFQTPSLAKEYNNPDVAKLAQIVTQQGGQLPWSDAAKLRTTIRNTLQADPVLRAKISDAQIDSIYGALTQDLAAGASQLGGPKAGRAWQQANQFYRAGNARIQQALQNFVGKETNPLAGETAYDKIVRMASDRGGADAGRLAQLKKALPADQWGDVAATTIDRLGKTKPGQADLGEFSVNSFVTNYANLSDQGKALLFGNSQARGELDNLAKVAGLQKGVERAANTSNTAVQGRVVAMTAAALQPHLWIPAAKAMAAMAATGEVMSNPAAVRWIAKATAAAGKGPKQLAAVNQQLGRAARVNAALEPLYQATQKLLAAPPSAIPAAATTDRQADQ